jgi:type III secretion protein S
VNRIDLIPLVNEALWLVVLLSGPVILVASLVGLLVALLQAVTQIQEQTLQYTIKFLAVVVTMFVTMGFVGSALYVFADGIFSGFHLMSR